MFKVLCTLLFLYPTLAVAGLSPEQKLQDFEQFARWIRNDYGPLDFKGRNQSLDFTRLYTDYKTQIPGHATDEEFRYLMVRCMAEFRDSHSKIVVPGDYTASLGFAVDLIQGKVLIEEIDRTQLSESDFPFGRGDELVALNGIPINEVINKIETHFGMSNAVTAKRIATFFLTKRAEKYIPVPTGNESVSVKSRGSGEISTVQIKWAPTGTPYSNQSVAPPAQFNLPVGRIDLCSETSSISIPPDADVVSDVPFTAYTVPTPNGRIGFIRIPHYYPVDSATGVEIAEARFRQYEKVIERFEAETSGLIIDQNFNCGGSILYLHKMLSLFVRHPFQPMTASFRASPDQVDGLRRQQLKMAPSTDGYDKFKFMIDEIETAKSKGLFMSEKLPLWSLLEVKLDLPGHQDIEPNPIGYTKPILLLINEMSGSGGDVFPAMMQDYGRAVLMGKATMGAGGHVWDDPKLELKNSGLQLHLTRSLIYRPNGTPIENSGVVPDIPYEPTEHDFITGYQDYLSSALNQMSRLIK